MIVGQVQPAMQGREALVRQILEQRVLQQVDMEVDDVESSARARTSYRA